jgi:outer membrane protein OmpA-like peptidoglycan-associated protein
MKTIVKTIVTVSLLGMLTACATQPAVDSAAAKQQAQQDYLVQALQNTGSDIQRQGNELLVTFPTKYLFAENSSAIRKSSGIPMLQYAQKILKSFNMTQMAVVTYAAGNEQLAEQRAAVVQSYMWDAHVYARIVFKKVEPISSHSHENPRVELQIQLAK